jgi:hypothetical protein
MQPWGPLTSLVLLPLVGETQQRLGYVWLYVYAGTPAYKVRRAAGASEGLVIVVLSLSLSSWSASTLNAGWLQYVYFQSSVVARSRSSLLRHLRICASAE